MEGKKLIEIIAESGLTPYVSHPPLVSQNTFILQKKGSGQRRILGAKFNSFSSCHAFRHLQIFITGKISPRLAWKVNQLKRIFR